MNEKRIREVLEVEQKAMELLAKAKREAEQLPIEAEAEASRMIESARGAAQDEARKIIEEAQKGNEPEQIVSHAQESMARASSLAEKNLEKAVTYVLERVLGSA